MGCLKIVPPKIFLIVPLGERHIFFKLNSFTLSSSGVIVAHLIPTPNFFTASAASIVIWSSVLSRLVTPKSKYFMSRSTYGRINLSLMNSHIILVISSPSISTTGLLTFILSMIVIFYLIVLVSLLLEIDFVNFYFQIYFQ